jgi:hypothetical protein
MRSLTSSLGARLTQGDVGGANRDNRRLPERFAPMPRGNDIAVLVVVCNDRLLVAFSQLVVYVEATSRDVSSAAPKDRASDLKSQQLSALAHPSHVLQIVQRSKSQLVSTPSR